MVTELPRAETVQEEKIHIIPPVVPRRQPVYAFLKRLFDICFSVFFGILLLIPMGIIALLIKLDSKGPVLFRQDRLGKDGKPFVIYKFRSMGLDAEADGPRWAEPTTAAAPGWAGSCASAAWTSCPSCGTSSPVI